MEKENDKRLNEVIRVKKRPSSFVTMDKTFLEDNRLSYKAKGILAYLLSKPDDWKVIIGNLVEKSTDGKSSVYAGLKELKECGYYEKVPIRNEQGTRIIRWESTIYELPSSLLTNFQEVENQDIENLYIDNLFLENRERNNNYNTNNYITNNNSSHVMSSQQKNGWCEPSSGWSDPCEKTDGQKDLNATLAIIHENISYDDLKVAYSDEIGLIDEFVNIILDALLSESKIVRVNGENKPRELVKSNLTKLTYADIVYVLEQFKTHGSKITKKHQYILSMLYNSPMERNAHFQNLVHTDLGY